MQLAYRSTRRLQPDPGETLVGSRDQAEKLLVDLDRRIADKQERRADKAANLVARATLYEAMGDQKMLDAAYDAWNFSKSSKTAALVAVAIHHFGRLEESMKWYEQSYKYPHEQGFEIDIGWSNALLFMGKWKEAWPIVRQLKKRMVYAAYLPDWKGQPTGKLSVIAEGGFGDVLLNSRFLPLLKERGVEDVTVYLPPYFYKHGFVTMAQQQPWFPEIKSLLDAPMKVWSTGFFDLPGIFDVAPETVPFYPEPWNYDHDLSKKYNYYQTDKGNKKVIGFCPFARAMETPLCPNGVYRSLTKEQAQTVLHSTSDKINWVSLLAGNTEWSSIDMFATPIGEHGWDETAAIISQLDAVVTVDTGVAHVAAAMGKPTHVLLSGAVDWKYMMDGTTCPWYPSMTLWRNNAFGFDNTVNNIIHFLNTME